MKNRGEKISPRLKFTEEEMRTAVLRIVEDGASLHAVSQERGLCKKTLKSYLDKYLNTATEKKGEFAFRPNYEINQVFTHELERVFEQYLLNVDRGVQPINRAYVRRAAYEFAMSCNVHVPKTWNVRKQAGLDWMYGFLNRHPTIKRTVITNKKLKAKSKIYLVDIAGEDYVEEVISVEDVDAANADLTSAGVESSASESAVSAAAAESKRPQSPYRSDTKSDFQSAASGSAAVEVKLKGSQIFLADDEGCTSTFENLEHRAVSVKTAIDEFEENLREAYCAIAHDGRVPSDRVFNLDEIALVVENLSSRTVLTACCCVAANGSALPPFVIFPRCKFRSQLLDGYGDGVCGVASEEGVIDDRLFLLVLQHFRDITHTSRHRRAVLIIDDDDYHVTVDSIDFCQTAGIELVTLPPQSAGKLQPIERYTYRTFKSYFNGACSKFRANNVDYEVSVYDISALFNAIYPLAFTAENIIRGFDETGLYPLDEKVFAEVNALPLQLISDELPSNEDVELVPSDIRESDQSEAESADEAVAVEDDRLATDYELRLADNFEQTPLDEYRNGLAFAFAQLEAHGGLWPERLFNMDEIELVVRTDEADLRLVGCCCVNAAGQSVPPMFVQASADQPLQSGIEGARSYAIAQFERENEVFAAQLRHFAAHVAPTRQRRVLLLVDDEHSHVTVRSIDFCAQRGIVLVTVPSQAGAPLQPLEKTLFGRLTCGFSAECDRRLQRHGSLTMADMMAIFENVYERAFEADAVACSFDEVGIWPLDAAKIGALFAS